MRVAPPNIPASTPAQGTVTAPRATRLNHPARAIPASPAPALGHTNGLHALPPARHRPTQAPSCPPPAPGRPGTFSAPDCTASQAATRAAPSASTPVLQLMSQNEQLPAPVRQHTIIPPAERG